MPNAMPTHKPRANVGVRTYEHDRPSPSKRGYGAAWQKLRRVALQRDNGICVACGKVVGLRGHVDHIVPLSSGGGNDLANLQTLCASCHSIKTDREDGGYGRDKKKA